MIPGILRLLLGFALVPMCWAFGRTLWNALTLAAGSQGMSAEVLSLVAGLFAFALSWMTLGRPVRAYVLGHELTHALWGLFFGARPSDVRVSATGGSVKLSKSNVFITLAPYFFPFYTFIVILAGIITFAFLRPLPCLPLWMFLIGFTWAFHVLFTLDTLAERQPDVKLYGRVFSWTFIFLCNVALVLVWLASMTPLTFAELGRILWFHTAGTYGWLFGMIGAGFKWIYSNIPRS